MTTETVYTFLVHPIGEDNDSTFVIVKRTQKEAEAALLEALDDMGEDTSGGIKSTIERLTREELFYIYGGTIPL